MLGRNSLISHYTHKFPNPNTPSPLDMFQTLVVLLLFADLRDIFLSNTPVVFTSYIAHCYVDLYFTYVSPACTCDANKLLFIQEEIMTPGGFNNGGKFGRAVIFGSILDVLLVKQTYHVLQYVDFPFHTTLIQFLVYRASHGTPSFRVGNLSDRSTFPTY